jgi:hypothetical protein
MLHWGVEEHHLILIIAVLTLMVVVISSGKGLGTLVNYLLKKVLGTHEVTVINEMPTAPRSGRTSGDNPQICKFSPEQCNAHQAEFERSKRNEGDIKNLQAEFVTFKTTFFAKLDGIEEGINAIRVTLAETKVSLNMKLQGDMKT